MKKARNTKNAHQIFERIDAIVGKLVAAQLKVHPDAVIAIASDHGFAATTTEINLYRAFIDAGLTTPGADGKIKQRLAAPGGSSAIMLADPGDEGLVARVEAKKPVRSGKPDCGDCGSQGNRAHGGQSQSQFLRQF